MDARVSPKTETNMFRLLPLMITAYLAYLHLVVPLLAVSVESEAKVGSPESPDWQYTGYRTVDNRLSLIIGFFLTTFDHRRFAFMPEFFASAGPAMITPIIEMRRSGHRASTIFVSMLAFGTLYQNFGAGFIAPLWWTLYLWLSSDHTVSLQAEYADASLIGYVLGYVIPTIVMVAAQTPRAVAAWQFFPAYILGIQALVFFSHLLPTKGAFSSSYAAIQSIHGINILWAATTHTYTRFQAFNSVAPLDAMKHYYLPTYSPSSVGPLTAACQAFFKWDFVYIVATTLFTGFWLLRGTKSRLTALGWTAIVSLCFGPGAAQSIVWVMRERQLEDARIRIKRK